MTKGMCFSFFILYKNGWGNLLSNKKGDVILSRAEDYYENDNERLREQARGKYKNLSEVKKNKKREYRTNRYHNISEEKKQKLKEYQKKKKITVGLKRLDYLCYVF